MPNPEKGKSLPPGQQTPTPAPLIPHLYYAIEQDGRVVYYEKDESGRFVQSAQQNVNFQQLDPPRPVPVGQEAASESQGQQAPPNSPDLQDRWEESEMEIPTPQVQLGVQVEQQPEVQQQVAQQPEVQQQVAQQPEVQQQVVQQPEGQQPAQGLLMIGQQQHVLTEAQQEQQVEPQPGPSGRQLRSQPQVDNLAGQQSQAEAHQKRQKLEVGERSPSVARSVEQRGLKLKAMKATAKDGLSRIYSAGFKKALAELQQENGTLPEWLRSNEGQRRCFPFRVPKKSTHTLLKDRATKTKEIKLRNVSYIPEEVNKSAAAVACLFNLQPWQVPIVRVNPIQAGGIAQCEVVVKVQLPMTYDSFLTNNWIKEVDSIDVFLAHLVAYEEANATFVVAKTVGIFPGEEAILDYREFRHPVSYLMYREVTGADGPRGYLCAAWDSTNCIIHYH